MLIFDRLIVGGIKFVLGKVAAAVETELNDDTSLREQLLAAQMRVELGEMSQEEFAELEDAVLARLRDIKERQQGGGQPMEFAKLAKEAEEEGGKFTAEISFGGDEDDVRK